MFPQNTSVSHCFTKLFLYRHILNITTWEKTKKTCTDTKPQIQVFILNKYIYSDLSFVHILYLCPTSLAVAQPCWPPAQVRTQVGPARLKLGEVLVVTVEIQPFTYSYMLQVWNPAPVTCGNILEIWISLLCTSNCSCSCFKRNVFSCISNMWTYEMHIRNAYRSRSCMLYMMWDV